MLHVHIPSFSLSPCFSPSSLSSLTKSQGGEAVCDFDYRFSSPSTVSFLSFSSSYYSL